MKKRTILTLLLVSVQTAAMGQVFTQWDFNTFDGNGGTGTLLPTIGSGTINGVGGVFLSFQGCFGSTDPVDFPDDSKLVTNGYPPQGQLSGTRGVEFRVTTLGRQNIQVEWDMEHENGASYYKKLEYSIDGTTFTSSGLVNGGVFGLPFPNEGNPFPFHNNYGFNLSAIAGANNNPNFRFRLLTVFRPGATFYDSSRPGFFYTGERIYYDMVQVSGSPVPEPATWATLGIGLVAAVRRRSRNR